MKSYMTVAGEEQRAVRAISRMRGAVARNEMQNEK
jgi:hypothetical protein